jgi:hypothetical protein
MNKNLVNVLTNMSAVMCHVFLQNKANRMPPTMELLSIF